MKEYQVISRQATLHNGNVVLTEDQASARGHHLTRLDPKKDVYEITGPVSFKNGETFSYDGEVNKILLEEIGEVVDVEKAKKTAKSGGSPASPKSFSKMKKDELLAACAERKIDIPSGATNKDLVALLEEAAGEDDGTGEGTEEDGDTSPGDTDTGDGE